MASAGNTVDAASINQNIAEVANYLIGVHAFVERAQGQWSLNAGTTQQLIAAGITDSTQQYQVTAIISCLTNLKAVLEGGALPTGFNVVNACYAVLGVD